MDTQTVKELFEDERNLQATVQDGVVFVSANEDISETQSKEIIETVLFENTKYTTKVGSTEDETRIHIATVPKSTKKSTEYLNTEKYTVLIDDPF